MHMVINKGFSPVPGIHTTTPWRKTHQYRSQSSRFIKEKLFVENRSWTIVRKLFSENKKFIKKIKGL